MHLPTSMSFNSVISLIFPSAQATIPSPIFLSGSRKKTSKKPVNKNNKKETNSKTKPIEFCRYINDIINISKAGIREAKIHDLQPSAIFIFYVFLLKIFLKIFSRGPFLL